VKLSPGTCWEVRFVKDGQSDSGATRARAEGIANHSTGDLDGLAVGLPSKPGMEVESWLGGRGRAPQ